MKKITLIAFILSCFSIHAQYFENLTGTPDEDILESGKSTFIGGPGQVYAGTTNPSSFSPTTSSITVTHSDYLGTIIFNNEYTMNDASNIPVNTMDPHVLELQTAQGAAQPLFGVFGRFERSPGNNQLFYMLLDPSGNLIRVNEIVTVLPGYEIIDLGAVIYPETFSPPPVYPTEVYLVGTAKNSAPGATDQYIFVIRYDYKAETVTWGNIYDFSVPTPAVDKIFAKDIAIDKTNSTDLIVVGHFLNTTPPATIDAFSLIIHSNGIIGLPVHGWGSPTSDDYFTSVTFSNPSPSLPSSTHGFVVGGHTDLASQHNFDMWALRGDPHLTGPTTWNSIINNGDAAGASDFCYDIVERENTIGDNEYYAVGHTTIGHFGVTDVMVNKIDYLGQAVINGQFMYGGADEDWGYAIDFENDPTTAGLNIFGTWATFGGIGISDNYNIRTYFNGYGCNEYITVSKSHPGPGIIAGYPNMIDINSFTSNPMTGLTGGAMDQVICSVSTNGNGSNARVAPEEPKGDNESTLSPNPLNAGANQAIVEVESNEPTHVTVSIYDMLGRTYYSQPFNLAKGKNSLSLDISQTHLAAGMYSVRIEGEQLHQTIMLMVK